MILDEIILEKKNFGLRVGRFFCVIWDRLFDFFEF